MSGRLKEGKKHAIEFGIGISGDELLDLALSQRHDGIRGNDPNWFENSREIAALCRAHRTFATCFS